MKLLLICCALACFACGGRPAQSAGAKPPPTEPQETWLTALDRDHALVGKVWDTRARTFTQPEQLLRRLTGARFVLLGEKHDNPDHHRLQARLLQGLVAVGRRPALVLEMLELEQQAAVDAYLNSAGGKANTVEFGRAVRWHETSWPPLREYQPIFDVAWAGKLPIAAGNLAHDVARALVKQGLAALPPERVQALRLDQPFPEALQSALAEELRASHCGHLPERLIEPMALAQHARDAQMAQVMRKSGDRDGAVLIAGAGHVRRDRGVPYYLALEAPSASVLSVALREVEHGVSEPERYAEGAAAFDFIWFTPRASDEDPCAAFAKP